MVGYARLSTGKQSLDLQRDALAEAGCERTYTDEISGPKAERPGLEKALSYVRAGDTMVVWRLDWLGRSLKDPVERIEQLSANDVGFRSLKEAIDATSPTGKLIFHIFGVLAEFERNLIRERTMAGLPAAGASGRMGGRPRILTYQPIELAAKLVKERHADRRDLQSAWRVVVDAVPVCGAGWGEEG